MSGTRLILLPFRPLHDEAALPHARDLGATAEPAHLQEGDERRFARKVRHLRHRHLLRGPVPGPRTERLGHRQLHQGRAEDGAQLAQAPGQGNSGGLSYL